MASPSKHLRTEETPTIAIQIEDLSHSDESLPWELGWPGCKCWRSVPKTSKLNQSEASSQIRCPRVLLVVGGEKGIDLSTDIYEVSNQAKAGRIMLAILRGKNCSANKLKELLTDKVGWDVLIYLGHSNSGSSGGVIELGNGETISGDALQIALNKASQNGLRLLLLNSCSSLDIAKSAARAQIDWTLCSLELLPDLAAKNF